ncbi:MULTISPECIES: antitoxin [unclassified Leucobacter]|uniref:antitoxin n=1 Tax=unclassified Leucobacter TaxID=2621730 RepID=UPI00165D4B22|nr:MULTISPECIES: antitoxin [unclassified Leucobacter]MBC9927659.1 antitoxin [Leucobacter sp. cx-169]MBC9937343.1 antitoxin [Leucobacter sp. cx-87]
MGIEDLGAKAEQAAKQVGDVIGQNKEKIEAALKSEQAEGLSDKVLDGATGLFNKITGDKFADQAEDVRKNIDGAVGNE